MKNVVFVAAGRKIAISYKALFIHTFCWRLTKWSWLLQNPVQDSQAVALDQIRQANRL